VCPPTCLGMSTRQHCTMKITGVCTWRTHPGPLCCPSHSRSTAQAVGVGWDDILFLLHCLLLLLVDDLGQRCYETLRLVAFGCCEDLHHVRHETITP
jgi:hypothetical protein